MNSNDPTDRLVMLYAAWLKAEGLAHSQSNLERFVQQLHRAAADPATARPAASPPNGTKSSSSAWGWVVGVAVVVAIIWAAASAGSRPGSSSSATTGDRDAGSSSTSQSRDEPAAFSAPQVPAPASGYGTVGDGGAGCLEIAVPSGTRSYYVKLKRAGMTVWDVFLAPGSVSTFDVPTGTYDLTYAAGAEWYGWGHAFGPSGSYSQTSERFTFDSTSCWSVELFLQPGGNLGSSGIDYADF